MSHDKNVHDKKMHDKKSYDKKENENIIEGRNAVMEAFRSGKPVDKLYVLDGCQDGAVRSIIREARKHDTILNFVEKDRLNQLSETGKHQGVIASVAAYAIFPLQDVLCVGAEGRMNTPGIGAGNWSWRYQQSALKGELADELRGMTILYGRY